MGATSSRLLCSADVLAEVENARLHTQPAHEATDNKDGGGKHKVHSCKAPEGGDKQFGHSISYDSNCSTTYGSSADPMVDHTLSKLSDDDYEQEASLVMASQQPSGLTVDVQKTGRQGGVVIEKTVPFPTGSNEEPATFLNWELPSEPEESAAPKTIRERVVKTVRTGIPKKNATCIEKMSEEDFVSKYRLDNLVADSVHPGMSLLFAKRLSDGLTVVVKVREKRRSFDPRTSQEKHWRTAMKMQMSLPKSEALCEVMEVIETKRNYYVIMEHIDGQDLFETSVQEPIYHADAREIVRQVLLALQTMHAAGRIHKDLKMENVMVLPKEPGRRGALLAGDSTTLARAKLIDFDTVESWDPTTPKAVDVMGTDGYIAPEAYLGRYSPASDMYCVGVIAYRLLTRRPPSRKDMFDDLPGENFVGSAAMLRIHRRLKVTPIDFGRSPFDDCVEARAFCQRLLAFSAEERPSAEEALAHPWFSLPSSSLPERVRSKRQA